MRIAVFVFGLVLACSAAPSPTCAQANSDSTYTVQSGDTLYSIAREAGVSVRALMQWNDLDDPSIEVGQTLLVRPPEGTESDDVPSADASESSRQQKTKADSEAVEPDSPAPYGRHAAETGDTFVSLALRLGTTADTLFSLNDSTTAPLATDRSLRLPRQFGPPTHVVKPGETLYKIAGEYGVSARTLKAENDLQTNVLRSGQRLRIPGRSAPEVPALGEWAAPDSTGRVAVYPDAFAGRLTAGGTTYDPDDFVASHPSLPFGSVLLLSADDSTRHTFARVIDRGPVEEGVLLDVSDAVAQTLDLDPDEASSVALRIVWVASDSD